MHPVNGLYGHQVKNSVTSVALVALFLIAFVIAVKIIALAALAVAWALTFPLAAFAGSKVAGGFLSSVGSLVRAEVTGPGWGALTFALVYVGLALVYHRQIIEGMTGAVAAERRQHKRLYNIVENLAMTAGISMPRIVLIPDTALNAYACGLSARGATIAVSTGLEQRLDDRELSAVIAHEISHIRNGDIRVLLLMSLLGGIVITSLRRIWTAAMGAGSPIDAAIGTAGGEQNAELRTFMRRARNTAIALTIGAVIYFSGILPESGTFVVTKGGSKQAMALGPLEEFRRSLPPPNGFLFYLLFGSAIYLFAIDLKNIGHFATARKRFIGHLLLFVPMVYAFTVRARSVVSRALELVADAGAVELTKDPDALISALAKIHGNDELAGVHRAVDAMLISSSDEGWSATHPSFDERVAALTAHAGALGLTIARRTNLRTAAGRKEVATKLGPAAPVAFGRRAARPLTLHERSADARN